MKKITPDMIRRLQKDGSFKFEGVTREESRTLAAKLASAATDEYGAYGIARDAFGYYIAACINY